MKKTVSQQNEHCLGQKSSLVHVSQLGLTVNFVLCDSMSADCFHRCQIVFKELPTFVLRQMPSFCFLQRVDYILSLFVFKEVQGSNSVFSFGCWGNLQRQLQSSHYTSFHQELGLPFPRGTKAGQWKSGLSYVVVFLWDHLPSRQVMFTDAFLLVSKGSMEAQDSV